MALHGVMSSNRESSLAEKDRVEMFSDGVFAIVVTLMVLEIHCPPSVHGHLAEELLQMWPSYFAYALAFLYVGIIWLNHHGLFLFIRKVDLTFNAMNLFGLAMIALLPFPTGVMADAFRSGDLNDEKAAVVLYAIVAGLMSAAWLPAFPYLSRHPELLQPNINPELVAKQKYRPVVGVVSYAIAALLGWFVHPVLAIALFIFMLIYHAKTCQGVA